MMVSVRRSSIDLYRPAKQLGRIAKSPLLQANHAEPIERIEIAAICIKDDLITLLGLSKSPLIMECDRLLKRPKRADHSAIRE